jgi:WxcM-like, C-terminal
MRKVIHGVYSLPVNVYRDGRGELGVFEYPANLPFVVRRAFVIKGEADQTRAAHANSSDQLIGLLRGSLVFDLDNGSEKVEYPLARDDEALWIRAGVWLRLREFARETMLLVFSPNCHAESRHFPAPRPDLIQVSPDT